MKFSKSPAQILSNEGDAQGQEVAALRNADSGASRSTGSSAWHVSAVVACFAATLLIAACGGGGGGGGGGGSPAPAPPAPPPPSAGTYQVSGQIRISENTLVDSDVNDINAPYLANDTIATAQPVSNPLSLGGYVNAPGAGPNGRSRTTGDQNDYFRVDAVAGQTVSLVIGDPQAGDIDLYLYDASGARVAVSEGTGQYETLTFPSTGRFYVRALAFEGASSYVVAIGQTAAQGNDFAMLHRHADFVPGEVIVRWRQPAQILQAGKRGASSALSVHALSKVAGAVDADWLLTLDNPRGLLAQSPDGRQRPLAATEPLSTDDLKAATLHAIKQLRADPAVLHAEPNYIRRPMAVPADEFYRLQWHYPQINLPAAWDITTGSNSVIVAVVDTGVLLRHPDLSGQLIAGYDFITSPTNANDGNGPDNDPNDAGDHGMPNGSSSFHGTHVAGTIAASSNSTVGVAGVAWGARIMPVRVLGRTGGTSFDIIQGVLFAAGLPNSSGTLPARRADIINLSLGGPSGSQAEQNAYTQARNAGAIIVAAAGNESTAAPSYPAAYNGVISVSAVDIRRTLASYSNFGSQVDVAAPGGDGGDLNGDGYVDRVLSTDGDDSSGAVAYTYRFKSGTSMAAPHVAGVIALMKSVNPRLTPADIDRLLVSGRMTTDIGAPGRDDNFGHGLIDALKAVQAARDDGAGPTPAVLTVAPNALNFAAGTTTQTLVLSNGGTQALNVTAINVTPPAPWMSVTPSGGANGLGTYTFTVNRGTLAPGNYTTSMQIVSSANTVTVPVTMQVVGGGGGGGGTGPSSNLGVMYILLVDPATMAGVSQIRASANNGVYSFQFNNVAAGSYFVVAGSDPDNNDSICDIGEACGAYLTLDEPVRVTVNTGNRTGLNFVAGHVTAIGAGAATAATPRLRGGFKRLTASGSGTP